MNTGDYYWDELFKFELERADHELSRYNNSAHLYQRGTWKVFASYLHEAQRVHAATEAECVARVKAEALLFAQKLECVLDLLPTTDISAIFLSNLLARTSARQLVNVCSDSPPQIREALQKAMRMESDGTHVTSAAEQAAKDFLSALAYKDFEHSSPTVATTEIPLTCKTATSPTSVSTHNVSEAPTDATTISAQAITLSLPLEAEEVALSQERENVRETTGLGPLRPKPFTLEEIPQKELQKRLNRGEIAPRKEWLPTGDEKKMMSDMETQERLQFAAKLQTEAETALKEKGDKSQALTLYTQGVHLLEQVSHEDLAKAMDIQEQLSRFLRNSAVMNLALENYRAVIASCDSALKLDEGDGKALYLRGRARELLGETREALTDFRSLATSPLASDAHRMVGRKAWHQLKKSLAADREKITKTMQLDAEAVEDRETSKRVADGGLAQNFDSVGYPIRAKRDEGPLDVTLRDLPRPEITSAALIQLLEQLVELYTTPSVKTELGKLAYEAGFEERALILRLRKYLPPLTSKIYQSYENWLGPTYEIQKKKVDQAVAYYKNCPDLEKEQRARLTMLVAQIRDVVYGSTADD